MLIESHGSALGSDAELKRTLPFVWWDGYVERRFTPLSFYISAAIEQSLLVLAEN